MTIKIVVYVPNELGGVRNVTLSLVQGLQSLGHDVCIATNYKEILAHRNRFSSSVLISSLGAGLFNPLFSKSIYILHGFPMVDSQSFFARLLLRAIPIFVRRFGGKLVAVSHLTKVVHERLFGIKVHEVIHNGISDAFFKAPEDGEIEKQKTILYVGRLVEGKGIIEIINAFRNSDAPRLGYSLKFIGAGPLSESIKDASRKISYIKYIGELTEEQKVHELRRAAVFISMNSFEPMGVVFGEAIVTDCKIVAPHCGGHREFIPNGYPFFGCDPFKELSIVSALNHAIKTPFEYVANFDKTYFSYTKRVVPDYIGVLNNLESY